MSTYSYLMEEAQDSDISRFVVGAVILLGSSVLLLKRPQNDFMGGIYELPSGKVEEGESLVDALHREVLEETGVIISEIKSYLGHFDYKSKSGKKTRQFNFLVVGEEPMTIVLQEHDGHAWAKQDEIAKYPVTDSVKQVLGNVWHS